MIQAYDDEDNAPMCVDLPLPYRLRTWDEMIREWEGKHDGEDGHGDADGDRGRDL